MTKKYFCNPYMKAVDSQQAENTTMTIQVTYLKNIQRKEIRSFHAHD